MEADAKLKELEPKALAHDTWTVAQDGGLLIRQAAKAIGRTKKALQVFLLEEKLIYRKQATCGPPSTTSTRRTQTASTRWRKLFTRGGVRPLHPACDATWAGMRADADRDAAGRDGGCDQGCLLASPGRADHGAALG
ncbi:phage antirepressor KilAC domain-containing protein [Streptomyces californicus]|uniref:phage antirepressor KilAC domain-containing protein n=1 Tax=Streptomyces californicus TaxID=67351 RepID=UPI0037A44D5A